MARKTANRAATHPAPAKRRRKADTARAEEDAYMRSLVAHGQAARPGADGRLPPGATHELVEEPDGRTRAVRRRFSSV